MSFDKDFMVDQEPRKVFVNFLILNINQIEQRIYFARNHIAAIRPLQGIIASLDAKSKKALQKQVEQLDSFEDNVNLCSRATIKRIYNDVLNYLHKSYLSEITRGIIPASILPPTKPKPKAKQYKKTLSDGVI